MLVELLDFVVGKVIQGCPVVVVESHLDVASKSEMNRIYMSSV